MMYTMHYNSPLGGILLAADETGLTGLWFDGATYFADTLDPLHKEQATPILLDAKRWLDCYFRGQNPDFTPPLHPIGSPFRQEVWALLRQIPYGKPPATVRWPGSWRSSAASPICQRRRWAVPLGTMQSPSSSPAIGLSAQTAA